MGINLLVVISLLSILLSIAALVISNIAIIKCMAAEKSTHTVTFQPLDESLKNGLEDWGTSDTVLKKQAKLYREDLEDNLPEFVDNDEDKKIYSF